MRVRLKSEIDVASEKFLFRRQDGQATYQRLYNTHYIMLCGNQIDENVSHRRHSITHTTSLDCILQLYRYAVLTTHNFVNEGGVD
jgi:hypothetical protein